MKKSSAAKAKARKPAKKRSAVKKAAKKKTLAKGPARKKGAKKSAAAKPARKRTAAKKTVKKTRPVSARIPSKKPMTVLPGPPPGSVPPVEEPMTHDEAVGIITHYYSHLGVAVVQVSNGSLSVGDRIHITGHGTDITQTVASMEYEHEHVSQASAGQSVGIKLDGHAREHDIVYRVR